MKKITPLFVGLVIVIVFFSSYSIGLFSGMETFLEDRLFSTESVDPRIVIVAIDDASITEIGQWPWPRGVYATLVKQLEKAKPRVVGFDVMLSERSRLGVEDDATLARALERTPLQIVFPIEAQSIVPREGEAYAEGKIVPLKEFKGKNVSFGIVNIILDPDGFARRFPGKTLFSQSETQETFSHFARVITEKSGFTLPLGTYDGIERIVYQGKPGSFERISLSEILNGKNLESLSGKIVLIGATAPDLHDEAPTPVSHGKAMPGVEIHANISAQILSGSHLVLLHPLATLLWIVVLVFLLALFFMYREGVIPHVFLAFILSAVSLVTSIVLFEKGVVVNILHTVFAPLVAVSVFVAYEYIIGEEKRRELEGVFSKYVSRGVLEEILQNPGKVTLGGEERVITVLFSDIRGFTTLSESVTPAELVRILNIYFTAMTEEIMKEDGVLDKFVGDAVMAFWGAPLHQPDHADRAIRAAKGMERRLEELNEVFKKEGTPEIKIGIGLYTGEAIAGNVGSSERFNYTVMGDTVNVSSRLEGLTKNYGVMLIVGQSTKESAQGNWKFKELDTTQVKGRNEPVHIYSVL